jgi:uncharacterized membrane protein (DUF106 family)
MTFNEKLKKPLDNLRDWEWDFLAKYPRLVLVAVILVILFFPFLVKWLGYGHVRTFRY